MNDLQVQPPFCDPVYDTNCGYPPVVPILYFYSFLLLTEYTMLKLVVAVILDNFSSTVDMDLEKEVRVLLAVRVLLVPVIWKSRRCSFKLVLRVLLSRSLRRSIPTLTNIWFGMRYLCLTVPLAVVPIGRRQHCSVQVRVGSLRP